MGDCSTRAMQIPHMRRRHQSMGSSGSYDSGSSTSGSPPLPADLLILHLTHQQALVSQGGLEQQLASPDSQVAQKNVNPTRYKTELCRPFEESGYCKYGEKCQFAHGHDELRSLSRHPKYKTELCRTYHTTGFCPYGPRCHFIHNEDELKLTRINQQKQTYILQQMAQHVVTAGQHHVLSRVGNQEVISLAPPQLVYSRGCGIARPRALDFSGLHLPMSLVSPVDSPPLSDLESVPSLSPTLSLLSPDELFGGIATPPPGFTAPPPPPMLPKLTRHSQSPLDSALPSPAKSADSARCSPPAPSKRSAAPSGRCATPPSSTRCAAPPSSTRCATPPKMGLASLPRSDQCRDIPISPMRLPFFNNHFGVN